ncbi:hypothetical protein EJB05_29036 [Eragrostis curvula]|uniref:RRM domain-containing protein n=1 Tax=Eragrostis curvula TaxID=38414 RepID=A0A5J9UTN3_9POAL|nr:hypothetical protein EJB05_29036 [Eragrostis curvula]
MAAAPAGAQNRCVFVGNIPYDATEEQLVQICEEVGPVVSFRLVIDKETGKPKGYGFCEYKDEETALSARRNLQGYEINGRQLRVDFAENGRNTDRNREKVEDPWFFTVDEPFPTSLKFCVKMRSYGQKQLSGPSVAGDASLHQPVGLTPAIHAASVMAGVLGGSQTANVQNGLPVQYGLGNDPLTHYLARMSRHQLHEIMSELKVGMQSYALHLLNVYNEPVVIGSNNAGDGDATDGLMSQTQSQFTPQHPRPPVMPTSVHQLPLTHPHIPQVPAAPETLPNEIRGVDRATHLAEFAHPSKLRKLEDGTSVPGMVNNSLPVYSAPNGPSGGYNTGSASIQQPENEGQQLTPDVESALLQQVLQLTPEQLSSLPLEQQQQVIQLQKMLSAGK